MPSAEPLAPHDRIAGQMKTSFHLEGDIRTLSERNATGICALAAKCPCNPNSRDTRSTHSQMNATFSAGSWRWH